MPPWYIDKNVGVQGFKYDRSLSDAEIATLAAWVDGGALRGNPARHAAARRVRGPRPVAHRRAGLDRAAARAVRRGGRGAQLVGRLLRRFGPDRGPLDQGGRDQAVGRGLPGRPPRRDPAAAVGRRRRGRLPERVRAGQERRRVPRRHRPHHPGGLDHQLQHALRLGRPRDHGPDQRGADVLPQGGDAQARAVLAGPWATTTTSTSRRARTTCGTTATTASTPTCG